MSVDEEANKNKMEINVSGITIRLRTSETVSYMNDVADEVQERMDSFFSTRPSQGVDVSQRLLMSCLTFVDDKNKKEINYQKKFRSLKEKTEYAQKVAEDARKKEIEWMNKYNKRDAEIEKTTKENKELVKIHDEDKVKIQLLKKDTESLEVHRKRVADFEKKEKDWEDAHNRAQRDIARLRTERNTCREELEKTKPKLDGVEHVAEKSKDNIKKWEDKISKMQQEFETLMKENKQLKADLEDAETLNELYEEENRND